MSTIAKLPQLVDHGQLAASMIDPSSHILTFASCALKPDQSSSGQGRRWRVVGGGAKAGLCQRRRRGLRHPFGAGCPCLLGSKAAPPTAIVPALLGLSIPLACTRSQGAACSLCNDSLFAVAQESAQHQPLKKSARSNCCDALCARQQPKGAEPRWLHQQAARAPWSVMS